MPIIYRNNSSFTLLGICDNYGCYTLLRFYGSAPTDQSDIKIKVNGKEYTLSANATGCERDTKYNWCDYRNEVISPYEEGKYVIELLN